MKRILTVGFILVFLISFNVYGGEKLTFEEEVLLPKKVYIPVLPRGVNVQFWEKVKEGVLKAARDYNVEVTYEGPKLETDTIAQLNIL